MDPDEDFAAFMAAAWPGLFRAARLMVPAPVDAEDLVQAALLKTYVRWGSLREVDAAGAYVRKVLVHLAMKSTKRRWHGEAPTARLPEPATDDEYVDVERADVARRALDVLTPSQRATLVLRYYCDLTEAETADALGCSIGTVKSRTHRSLAALRAHGYTAEEESADER